MGLLLEGTTPTPEQTAHPMAGHYFPATSVPLPLAWDSLGIPFRMARRQFVPDTAFSTTDGDRTANLELSALLLTTPSIFPTLRLTTREEPREPCLLRA